MTMNEGGTFTGTLTLDAPHPVDDVIVNWGDGSTPATTTGALSHTYADNGNYWINVTVVDDQGTHALFRY